MLELNAPGICKALSKRILEDIDEYCVRTYDTGHREHLGASLIGYECKRQLWYTFRWCYHKVTSGRQQRLFNRGHREEARFLEWLRGIGFTIFDLTEDGKQYRISDCGGHFGGSLDGQGFLPERYQIEEKVLFEFKTNGTGTGFNSLCKDGIIISKKEHYAQMSTYGYKCGLKYGCYFNINKNDDDLHVEVVKLNHKLGEQMVAKAEQIILSQSPPPRLSDNLTFHKCVYLCDYKEICHGVTPIEKNCRSCIHAHPVENTEWNCMLFKSVIPKDFIKVGCPEWVAIC